MSKPGPAGGEVGPSLKAERRTPCPAETLLLQREKFTAKTQIHKGWAFVLFAPSRLCGSLHMSEGPHAQREVITGQGPGCFQSRNSKTTLRLFGLRDRRRGLPGKKATIDPMPSGNPKQIDHETTKDTKGIAPQPFAFVPSPLRG